MSNYQRTLTQRDSLKIIKSVSQELREQDNQASKVVHQLEDFKDKYLEILSHPIELTKSENVLLEQAYSNVPDDVITRKIKEKATYEIQEVMTLDLNDLLNYQLKINQSEIQKDIEYLKWTLRELDALSDSLETVINLPECLSFAPWKGAELAVIALNDNSPKENKSLWTVVKIEYPNEVSYVISTCFKICHHFIDYSNKYWFAELLGNTAITHADDEILELFKDVIEQAKANVRILNEKYIEYINIRIAPKRIKVCG